MISRPKARSQFLCLVHKAKQDSSSSAKNLAITLWWQLTNKIPGTQYHHNLIFYSSYHVPRRVLGGATKVEPGTIRVGGEQLLVITGDLIAMTVTQRASRCHYWLIWSSIHLRCPWFVNSYPGLHITVLVITNALIAIKLTQRAMSCRHPWYLRFPHEMIHSLIQLSCPCFVNSHPALCLT